MSATPLIIYLDEIYSTNSYFEMLEQKPEEGTTVYAGFQTAGRGQKGNSWESEKDANLIFSTIIYPESIGASQQFIISQMVSLAVFRFLSAYTSGVKIKWPNDIYLNNKKICGMLIENTLVGDHIGQSIIGIGININQTSFASDAPNPVSLKNITGETYEIDKLIREASALLIEQYERLKGGNVAGIRAEYKENLYRAGGFYKYRAGASDFEAVITDVDDDGVLHLRTREGHMRRFLFKEVSYLFP